MFEVFIDCFYHIADITSGLLNVDDAGVFERFDPDKRRKSSSNVTRSQSFSSA
jgi:hypothetical protein